MVYLILIFCFFFLGSLEPTIPEDFNEARRPSFLDAMGSVDPNSPAMKALIQLRYHSSITSSRF